MKSLSIITINYNNRPGLQKTFNSVLGQFYKDFEYIIIDGGSTDGSKELIEKNATAFSYWVSEKDQGIYNAMNKGIIKAKAKYLLFLNSGDFLVDEKSLESISLSSHDEDIICADIKINEMGRHWIKKAPDSLSFDYFTKDIILIIHNINYYCFR
jgi:glycosyltransferase involved in cell wall biosynthesis